MNADGWPEMQPIPYAYDPPAKSFTVKVKTTRSLVEDFLDKYNRDLLGSKEAEELIRELENI